jgi:sugar O-acyltransferase (sialic acid O-acetyltransferase NeuD family)
MKQVFIVGAGGFGREVLAWLRQHPACGADWTVAGFVDDNPDVLSGFAVDIPLAGSVEGCGVEPAHRFVCALGQPSVKRRVVERLRERGARFMSFLHPSAVLGERVRLGDGVVICPGVILTADIEVGSFVALNCAASAGHDCRIGAFATISGHVDLTSRTHVGEGVFVGSHAVLTPGVRVGEGALVGAGSVVINPVRAGSTVFGNPARPVRQV